MFKKGSKVVVRQGWGAEGKLTVGKAYELFRDFDGDLGNVNIGHRMVRLVNDDRNQNDLNGQEWFAHRFLPYVEAAKPAIIGAPKPEPLSAANAKVGMKVVLHDVQDNPAAKDIVGQEVVIHAVGLKTVIVSINGVEQRGAFKFARFYLVPAAPVIAVGCKLIVLEAHRESGLRKDKIVTLKKISPNGKTYLLEEYAAYYKASRFSLVGGVVQAPTEPPKAPGPFTGDLRALLRAKDKGPGGVCSFAWVQNGRPRYAINPACYAPLHITVENGIPEFAVSTASMVKHLKKPFAITYLQWLLNTSPWASCFVTKDASEAYDKGVMMDTNKPIGELVGAATALRESTEFNRRNAMFQFIIDKGFDGTVAYAIASMLNKAGKSISYQFADGGHQAIRHTLSAASMLSFYANGFPKSDKKPMKEYISGFSVTSWIEHGFDGFGEQWGTYVKSNCKSVEKGTGWDRVVEITEEAVLAFASKLVEDIKGVKK